MEEGLRKFNLLSLLTCSQLVKLIEQGQEEFPRDVESSLPPPPHSLPVAELSYGEKIRLYPTALIDAWTLGIIIEVRGTSLSEQRPLFRVGAPLEGILSETNENYFPLLGLKFPNIKKQAYYLIATIPFLNERFWDASQFKASGDDPTSWVNPLFGERTWEEWLSEVMFKGGYKPTIFRALNGSARKTDLLG